MAARWTVSDGRRAMMASMSNEDEDLEKCRLVARRPGQSTRTDRSFLTVDWNSTDLWNLDLVLADIIADGLNEFRNTSRETGPPGMTDEAWDAVLGDMVDGIMPARETQGHISLDLARPEDSLKRNQGPLR